MLGLLPSITDEFLRLGCFFKTRSVSTDGLFSPHIFAASQFAVNSQGSCQTSAVLEVPGLCRQCTLLRQVSPA
jgi:hypothetical protein